MRNAVSVLIASDKPVCAMENGRVVGIVDRAAVLEAIAEEGGD
jgi:predicted transcriptional regulator